MSIGAEPAAKSEYQKSDHEIRGLHPDFAVAFFWARVRSAENEPYDFDLLGRE